MHNRLTGRRGLRGRAALVLVLALAATLAPTAAHAEPGGTTRATAVVLPVSALDGQFTGSNAHISTPSGTNGQVWNNVAWYSVTPTEDVRLYVRATSPEWDNTLELWSGDTFITHNDDSYGLDAALLLDLTAGTTYQLGLGGYSSNSRGSVTMQLATRVPSAPTDLTATAGDGSVVLEWSAPTDAAGGITRYTVYCTLPESAEQVCTETYGTPPGTSTTITGLTNGQSVAFRVVAVNLVGVSESSATVSAVPRATTTTTVTVDPADLVAGQTFDVHVTVGASSGTAEGTVDVTVGGTTYPGLALVAGSATVQGLVASGGPLTASAVYAGTATVGESTGSVDVTVARRAHTVTLSALPVDLTYGDPSFTVTGTSSLGLPLTYTAAGACAVEGDVVRLVAAGTCEVTASHPGDGDTEPAAQTLTTEVVARTQVITMAELPPLVYGTSVPVPAAESSVGLPVTLTVTGPCQIEDGMLIPTDVGPCTVVAFQDGDPGTSAGESVERTGVIAQRADVVTLGELPALRLGQPEPAPDASSQHGLPVVLEVSGACTLTDGYLTAVRVGACVITASTAGDRHTLPASARVTIGTTAPAPGLEPMIAAVLEDPSAGASVFTVGQGLLPGSEVTLVLGSEPRLLATAVVEADGSVLAAGVLPADLEVGEHELVAYGTAADGSPARAALTFELAADGTFLAIGDARVVAGPVPAIPVPATPVPATPVPAAPVVAAAPAAASATTLAVTGTPAASGAALAAVWLVLGTALVLVSRRRTARA
ncbi:fibronectin type III domain-containing protein [Cellulomonas sp. S1-8]|uniref:fibronectin type III domain-containing protein n=1 Tax=Cellulomonas sp. S1-8 TaxID=2904790 RepID=UPI002244048B|nr:fibronectin type III domain-containing protein [Cellulomonas sp. S1-8]UZN02652.1 fibronectin type III domain-containing protein [Cellulomonas sp. S1-8]